MKRLLVLIVLVLMFTFATFGQEVEPRGFDDPSATTTTEPTAEAVTETVSEETPTKQAEPASETSAAPADEIINSLRARVTETEKRLDATGKWIGITHDRITNLENAKAPKTKPGLPWYGWILIVLLVAGDIVLFATKAGKAKDEEETDQRNRTRGGAAAALVAMFAIGSIASSAKAECVIKSISTGSVIVKEQKTPADFSLTLAGCEKEVKALQAGAKGVNFTDVKSEKGTVTAKVTADASAQTGPALIRVQFADGTHVTSAKNIFALILDPQAAAIRKDAIAAKTEAASVRKEVKAVEFKVSKLDAAIASRPTANEINSLVAQAVAPYQARVAQLEQQLGEMRSTQSHFAERLALLSKATELLAQGQSTLASKRVGLFRRPLNASVAQAADSVREAVSTEEVLAARNN